MTTATTSIGPTSAAISYSAGATVVEIADAVQAFITTKGWTLFDATAGVNLRCYRALNADGVSYKYVVIDLSNALYLTVKVYESWNATTKVGLNLAFSSDNVAYSQRLTLSNSGYVYVFASPRWVAFLSKMNDGFIGSQTGNSFTGCFEISRDNDDEVPGEFPIFAWMNGSAMLGNSQGPGDGTYPRCYALPRSKGNGTADLSSRNMTVATLAGESRNTSQSLSSRLPSTSNPWSTANNNFVFTAFAVENAQESKFNIRGRFYGVKVLANNLGTPFDLITIKTDASTFYSPSGTVQDHHILPTLANNRIAIPT